MSGGQATTGGRTAIGARGRSVARLAQTVLGATVEPAATAGGATIAEPAMTGARAAN